MEVAAVLAGARVLIVEDDYMLASELAQHLATFNVVVVGPAPTVDRAMRLLSGESGKLDAALLDVNLRGQRIYPVADKLLELGIPLVFTTGYDELLMDPAYVSLPRCTKPIDNALLIRTLAGEIARDRQP